MYLWCLKNYKSKYHNIKINWIECHIYSWRRFLMEYTSILMVLGYCYKETVINIYTGIYILIRVESVTLETWACDCCFGLNLVRIASLYIYADTYKYNSYFQIIKRINNKNTQMIIFIFIVSNRVTNQNIEDGILWAYVMFIIKNCGKEGSFLTKLHLYSIA